MHRGTSILLLCLACGAPGAGEDSAPTASGTTSGTDGPPTDRPTCDGTVGTSVLSGGRYSICKGWCGPRLYVHGNFLVLSEYDGYTGDETWNVGQLTAAGHQALTDATAAIQEEAPPPFTPSGYDYGELTLCVNGSSRSWGHDGNQPLPAHLDPAWAFLMSVWGPMVACDSSELVEALTDC